MGDLIELQYKVNKLQDEINILKSFNEVYFDQFKNTYTLMVFYLFLRNLPKLKICLKIFWIIRQFMV